MAGRKPKPTAMKKEWERLAKLMNQMGVLTEVDMAAFAAYCQSYARWKEAQEHITSGGSTFETYKGYQQQTPWVGIANTNQKLMLQAASEFGLTPSSRSRIVAGNGKAKETEDEMGHYLGIVVSFLYGRSDGYAESCTAVFAELLQSERKRCEGETRTAGSREK